MEEASTNTELKASDATCNPCLAVGGVIAAGLGGPERGLEPPDSVEVTRAPSTMTTFLYRATGEATAYA